jgi:HxlR-like helix-turn-helix
LLTRRLHELHRAGVIEINPKPDGHGSTYSPTEAGHALRPVLQALADWAENWIEVRPEHAEHADPGIVLHSWCDTFLRRDRLPPQRVVARFDYTQRRRRMRTWLLIEHGQAEVCLFDPGFGDDLVVTIAEPLTFTRWHLGFVDWPAALRSGDIHVSGLQRLRKALPTWNGGPAHYSQGRRRAVAR